MTNKCDQGQTPMNQKDKTVDSRYIELGYVEFCETRSDYLNKKYISIAFSNHNLALETFLQVQITRSANCFALRVIWICKKIVPTISRYRELTVNTLVMSSWELYIIINASTMPSKCFWTKWKYFLTISWKMFISNNLCKHFGARSCTTRRGARSYIHIVWYPVSLFC